MAAIRAEAAGQPVSTRNLLAPLLLTESRRSSRMRADGSLVLIADQDRRQWDRALIDEGHAIVSDARFAGNANPPRTIAVFANPRVSRVGGCVPQLL